MFCRNRRVAWNRVALTILVASACFSARISAAAEEPFLAKGGQPQATIVVGPQASAFDRWVAGELQRYLKQLSGAELPIVASDKAPKERPLIAVGGPQSNPLAASAEEKQLVKFAGLKPDGFVLKRIELGGVPVLLAGGNDEASTMYAAYELLERLGIVFQVTNDIIPKPRPDLPMPALDARVEPALKYRGMHCGHSLRWYMGLADFRKHIDQLAKLKLNCMQFYCETGSPWVEVSYGGKKAELYNHTPESHYLTWTAMSGTAKDVRVGRECFPQEYLGPPEFAEAKTPELAYAAAREFLREVIRYAHQRKVRVWLLTGEVPYVPPSLIKPGQKTLGDFYCGTAISPGDPAAASIWEATMASLVERYPEADSYAILTSEPRLPTDDPQTQALLAEYPAARKLILPVDEIHRQGNHHVSNAQGLESDLAQICMVDKVLRKVQKRYPKASFGMCLLFRGYMFRAADAILPKNVWLMNMENYSCSKSVMHFYGGIEGRELIAFPRIDDDGCEFHMQLNALMYDRDETIPGGVKHGMAGFVGQLNKERGLECNVRYMVEGAWRPDIHCKSFYEGYLGRLYGPGALDPLLKAFLLLEENDKALGWSDHHGIFPGYSLFSVPCLSDYKPVEPKLTRQGLEQDVRVAEEKRKFWDDRMAQCGQALELLRQARPAVLPGSRAELDYVIYKTETFIDYFGVTGACEEARAAFGRAWLAKVAGESAGFRKRLDETRAALDRADGLARKIAQQMTSYCDVPTEKYLLLRFNQNVIGSLERNRKYLAEVMGELKRAGSKNAG